MEPLEDLPAEQEEPSKDQMLVLEERGVHLPQQAAQVELPLVAFLEAPVASLEEVLAYQVVPQAYQEEPVASLAEQEAYQVVLQAYPEEPEASPEEALAYQEDPEASLAEQAAFLEEPEASLALPLEVIQQEVLAYQEVQEAYLSLIHI